MLRSGDGDVVPIPQPKDFVLWKPRVCKGRKPFAGLQGEALLTDGGVFADDFDLDPEVSGVDCDFFFSSDGARPGDAVALDDPAKFVFAWGDLKAACAAVSIDIARLEGNPLSVEVCAFDLDSGEGRAVAEDHFDPDEVWIAGNGLGRPLVAVGGDQLACALSGQERKTNGKEGKRGRNGKKELEKPPILHISGG